MTDPKDFIRMPLSRLTTPHDGDTVYTNRYWQLTADNEVLFYRRYSSPQCNSNKRIVERLGGHDFPGSTIVFVPVAYLPIPWIEYL